MKRVSAQANIKKISKNGVNSQARMPGAFPSKAAKSPLTQGPLHGESGLATSRPKETKSFLPVGVQRIANTS
jgi:hypothetical protein